jgi:hypothetical protein
MWAEERLVLRETRVIFTAKFVMVQAKLGVSRRDGPYHHGVLGKNVWEKQKAYGK